jgi:hypothetical protein
MSCGSSWGFRDKRRQATLKGPECANPAPGPSTFEQQPENQPEEGREQHREVFGTHKASRRVLVPDACFVCERGKIVGLVCGP